MRFITFITQIFAAMLIAGVYGALHDQISFTVSSEYFTEFKYHQFGFVDSPLPDRVKAAAIGFLASWWMGVPIGLFVGVFGFLHKPARLMFTRSIRAFGIVAVVALVVGIGGLVYGWLFASHNLADYDGWFRPEGLAHPAHFLSVGHMHNFSYLGGVIGMVAGIISQFYQRVLPPKSEQTGAGNPQPVE